jgi:hypothetical protein
MIIFSPKNCILVVAILVLILPGCKTTRSIPGDPVTYNFSFANNKNDNTFQVADAGTTYNQARGFGFEKAVSKDAVINNGPGFITSNKPFFFSVKLPEGNYNVKVTLGYDDGSSDVVIRAECRRMMVNRIQTKNGE